MCNVCSRRRQSEPSGWSKTGIFEMLDLNAASARLHQDQRASFCHDATTDADKFEKIIVARDHRINKVNNKKVGGEGGKSKGGK